MKAKVNGIGITYEVRNPEGQAGWVILLNGVMASYSSWDNLAGSLSKLGYRILLHDLRGQLLSDKPEGPYRWDDHVGDLKELMTVLGIEKAHLIGTSYGGELALCFSIECPESVETVAVIDSVSQVNPLLKHAIRGWIAAAEECTPEAFFRIMLPTIYGERFIGENEDFLENRAVQMKAIAPDFLTGQIELYRTFLELDITAALGEVSAPALVICGDADTLKPPSYSKIIADGIKNSRFIIIPDSGHVTIFEKPEELAMVITGFLRQYRLV